METIKEQIAKLDASRVSTGKTRNIFLSKWRCTVVAVFFLALLTRLAFVMTQQDGFYFPDSLLYSGAAVNLLSGGEFGADFGLSPGYPMLLAAVYLVFGQSIFAIR